jgi:hypothetical protein
VYSERGAQQRRDGEKRARHVSLHQLRYKQKKVPYILYSNCIDTRGYSMMASLDEEITARKSPTPHPLCGLSQEKVIALASLGVPLVGGLCQNPKRVDGELVKCGCPVGEHPSGGTVTTAPFTISHVIEGFHSYLTKLTSTQLLLLF